MADLRGELAALYSEHGKLTPQIVVDAARPVESPLHDHLEWDDTVAGEKYRQDQARQLIRSIRVQFREPSLYEGPRSFRAYSSVPDENGTGRAYLETAEIIQDPFQRKILVNQLRRDIAALNQKYSHLHEFIEELQAQLQQATG